MHGGVSTRTACVHLSFVTTSSSSFGNGKGCLPVILGSNAAFLAVDGTSSVYISRGYHIRCKYMYINHLVSLF
jgi:hypothetical protein